MQAMACGVPVVSTPVGAIREAVQENLTGLIVPPRDAKALAHSLEKLMSSATLRAEFSEAAIAYAQKNFGINVMLDRMTEVFSSVVNDVHRQGSTR
jgi:glycosyltransferase involved in cell wall biosynthesis